ncbi:hypothetical protein POL25_19535 [Nannocystis sp. bb15-2]|uniref:Uncharacterized protein n=1 Tax=Nannocystis bainbridge TaxID=2995303 RepID=A0ABT5DZQ2_9BACT|nr:hypothetical protein [Nannocystis bainbridge]
MRGLSIVAKSATAPGEKDRLNAFPAIFRPVSSHTRPRFTPSFRRDPPPFNPRREHVRPAWWYNEPMPARAALLSLVLAGPTLAAPPLSPTASNAEINDEITAADPTITTDNLAPLERLITAAELVESRLADTSDVKDLGDLLTLAVTARRVAYQRTNDAAHLCQLLATAERVLARTDTPPPEATDFRDEARAGLASHAEAAARGDARFVAPPCVQPTSEPKPGPVAEPEQAREPSPAMTAPTTGRTPPRANGLTIAGGVLLGTAALAALAIIPVQVRRAGAFNDLETLIAEIEQAGHRTPEQAQRMSDLGSVGTWTRGAKIGLAISAAVLGAVGVGMVARGKLRPTTDRARVAPYGGPQGAGLSIFGRF